MGLGDSWHKVAVYFGIADDDADYDEDETLAPHEELERSYQERPNVRKINGGRSGRNDYDDIVADELRGRGLRLAVAESCTGGMLGGRITARPGSSDYFAGGDFEGYVGHDRARLVFLAQVVRREFGDCCAHSSSASTGSLSRRRMMSLAKPRACRKRA